MDDAAWEDRPDHLTPEIDADYRSDGFDARYTEALELVGNRNSKSELAYLVAYLLKFRGQS